jgi:two-component system phosphate regulon sensor histidine kinase PhoR
LSLIVLRTLAYIAAVLLIAATTASLKTVHAGAWVLVVGLSLLALFHTFYLSRLHHWAALPRQRELPTGFGSWGVALDRLQRYMRQEALERSEAEDELAQLHAAVDLLPDGLVVLDRYDHIRWSNRAAQKQHGIFGTRRPIDHFIRQPEFIAYLQQGDFSAPVVLALPAMPGRLFALRMVPTREPYRLLITQDVTDADRVDRMRRDFVANISHEIRTPLTVVAGFIETLIDLDLPPDERRHCLEQALRQTDTMQRLVGDLLTLAALEHGDDPPTHEPIAVKAMLEAIASDLRAVSGGKHTLIVEGDDSAQVLGTPTELDSAVRNLMTNALRYTPAGGVVTASVTSSATHTLITVRDTGIGIPAEHLPRLTERFYRVDRGRSRETGGTGLGLAIVKHVAQRHHARLEIESEPGKGSRFSLRFPGRAPAR